ncbi:MAG: DNA polymerase III subunit gamma/tau [Roseburia faecis]
MAKNINICNVERPMNFDQMVGQKTVVENLRQQAIRKEFFQCYILEGQFGSGKTTMARIISRAINCEHPDEHGNPCGCCESCKAVSSGSSDIVELDAASNTGVDSIRAIKESVDFLPSQLKKKVYIIDEVQKLSGSAFDALLKVLEEPPEHVVFIMCTTESKKIPATVRSRAACYQFGQISEAEIAGRLIEIAVKYGFSYEENGIFLIAKNSCGSMRNAIKLLEQSGTTGYGVTEENVTKMLGLTSPDALFAVMETIVGNDIPEMVKRIRKLLDEGANPASMVGDMLSVLADGIVCSTSEKFDRGTEHYRSLLKALCMITDLTTLGVLAKGLKEVYSDLQYTPDEATLICGLIAMMSKPENKERYLEQKITDLERRVEELLSGCAESGKLSGMSCGKEVKETMDVSGVSKDVPGNVCEENSENKNAATIPEALEGEPEESRLETKNNRESKSSSNVGDAVKDSESKSEKTDENQEQKSASDDLDVFDLLGLFSVEEESAEEINAENVVSERNERSENLNSDKEQTAEEADVPEKEYLEKTQEVPVSAFTENDFIETEEEAWQERQREEELANMYFSQMQESQGANVPKEEDKSESENEEFKMDVPQFQESRPIKVEDNDLPDVLPPNDEGKEENFLPELYRQFPLMESVLELGFRKEANGWWVTDQEDLYRIAAGYRNAIGFPFGIRIERKAAMA